MLLNPLHSWYLFHHGNVPQCIQGSHRSKFGSEYNFLMLTTNWLNCSLCNFSGLWEVVPFFIFLIANQVPSSRIRFNDSSSEVIFFQKLFYGWSICFMLQLAFLQPCIPGFLSIPFCLRVFDFPNFLAAVHFPLFSVVSEFCDHGAEKHLVWRCRLTLHTV